MERKFPKAIYSGKEVKDITVDRFRTGNFVFDMITQGGIPHNRITVFHGPKQTSKTTFALMVAGKFLRENPDYKVVFLDFELTFDWDLARYYIDEKDIDSGRFTVIQPDYGEMGIDIVKAYVQKAEDVGLYIIDSFGGIVPTAETEAGAADYTQLGLQVRLINRMLRILMPSMSIARKEGQPCHVIAINQVRSNMDRRGHMGSPYSQPGGRYLEHAATMDVRFYSGKYKEVRKVSVSVEHQMFVEKNKTGIPKMKGFLKYWLAPYEGHTPGEYNEDEIVLTYAKRTGVIVREGNQWKVGNKLFPNLTALLEAFRANRRMFEKVKNRTLDMCVKNILLSAGEDD